MNLTGFVLLSVVGLVAGRVPAIYLLCASSALYNDSTIAHHAKLTALGTIATGLGCLLFAIIRVDAPYWSFGFPSAVLIVWGADFVFSAGMLFISRVAREDEQSVAGGIFQTCIQVRVPPVYRNCLKVRISWAPHLALPSPPSSMTKSQTEKRHLYQNCS